MGTQYRNYASKLSIPGKSNDELTYAFHETSLEHHHVPLTLFGIFSIKSTSEQYQLLISETVKNFLDYYRRTAESIAGTLKQEGINSGEFIFENAIQYTHERVTNALIEAQDDRGKMQGIDMKRVHFIIGALCEGQLYASVTGSGIQALYFYPVYQKHGFSHYASVDVIHGNKDSGEQSGSPRLFSSMINGSVSIPRSIVAICNSSFLDYISAEQLKQAVTSSPIEAVAPHFQRLLGKINAKNDFCALFLDAHYTPSASTRTHQQTVSNESMAVLNSKEEGTEKILFPEFAAHMQKIASASLHGITASTQGIFRAIRVWVPRLYKKTITAFTRLSQRKKNSQMSLADMNGKKKKKNILAFMKNFTRAQQKIFARFGALCIAFSTARVKSMHRTLATRLSILPHTSKSLLFISVIFLVLFGVSTVIIQRKNAEQKQRRAYAEMLRSAEEKSDLAEASLLYDNTEKARALLIETQQALREYPAAADEKNKERHAKVITRMQGITERINRIVPFKNFTALAQLETIIPSGEQARLTVSDTALLLYTPSSAYAVDLSNGALTPIQTQTKIPSIACGIGVTKTNFYLCDAGAKRIYALDAASAVIQPIPISLASAETSLGTLAIYNQRLYVLTTEQGTLFRHKKIANGFDAGTAIIKNLSLDQATASYAIDGSIYILERNGQISKYTSGKHEQFILPLIDPQPQHIKKIWTDADTSALYLLEPDQKRLLVIDKQTRSLKAQLVSDIFGSAQDIAFLPKKKKLFVISGVTLYHSPLDIK